MSPIWVDAQMSPDIARFIESQLGFPSRSLKSLGLRDARDPEIFHAARDANAIVMSKDEDFALLLEQYGPPPKIIWVTCGNTSNENLQLILRRSLPRAMVALESDTTLVEIF